MTLFFLLAYFPGFVYDDLTRSMFLKGKKMATAYKTQIVHADESSNFDVTIIDGEDYIIVNTATETDAENLIEILKRAHFEIYPERERRY